MPKPSEITVVRLFWQMEALRVRLGVNIPNMAFMLGVTLLAYKNWKNHGTEPRAHWEPKFRDAIANLKRRYQESEKQS